MLHDFSSAFRVSSCQAEWLWPIANLKSLMPWNGRLHQVQNIRLRNNWFLMCTITSCCWVCPSAKWTHDWMAEKPQDPFRIIWHQRMFLFKFPAYSDRKYWNFQIWYSKQLNSGLTVTVMHFNEVFCSILAIFSQQELFFPRLTSLCFLNNIIVTCILLVSVLA